jgi:hypothetical protein
LVYGNSEVTLDRITGAELETLIGYESEPCVSVYMPTHRAGREVAQGPIRLKNLLTEARDHLIAGGTRPGEADHLLAETARLGLDGTFWRYQEDGLALFIAPGLTRRYRLPANFDELVVVSDAFHVKPLWPVVAGGDRFHLLALSRNQVRLLWADRFRVSEIDLPDELPTSLSEALWFEDPERQLQHRGADRVGVGRVVAAFHGHGAADENDENRLERFLRAVDGGIGHLVEPESQLLLAGVEEVVAVYRKVANHKNILTDSLRGNPDQLSDAELHQRSLAIIGPLLEELRQEDAAAFLAAGDRAVGTVIDALVAALQGRVATIFLPAAVSVWGTVDADNTGVVVHPERTPGDRDLLDLAGAATWRNGGTVHVVDPADMPSKGTVAAQLRF